MIRPLPCKDGTTGPGRHSLCESAAEKLLFQHADALFQHIRIRDLPVWCQLVDNLWQQFHKCLAASSPDIPVFDAISWIFSRPSACFICSPETGTFWPMLIQEPTTSPRPLLLKVSFVDERHGMIKHAIEICSAAEFFRQPAFEQI